MSECLLSGIAVVLCNELCVCFAKSPWQLFWAKATNIKGKIQLEVLMQEGTGLGTGKGYHRHLFASLRSYCRESYVAATQIRTQKEDEWVALQDYRISLQDDGEAPPEMQVEPIGQTSSSFGGIQQQLYENSSDSRQVFWTGAVALTMRS
jgi:hypothetical protein